MYRQTLGIPQLNWCVCVCVCVCVYVCLSVEKENSVPQLDFGGNQDILEFISKVYMRKMIHI